MKDENGGYEADLEAEEYMKSPAQLLYLPRCFAPRPS